MMSMETGRRQVVQTAAAAAVAAPLLRANPAAARSSAEFLKEAKGKAPVITIFDHRGCNRGGPNKEYTGGKSGDQDDEMMVKVQSRFVFLNEKAAASFLNEAISLKGKGVDGPYTGNLGYRLDQGIGKTPQ